jgi:hypothetical protein
VLLPTAGEIWLKRWHVALGAEPRGARHPGTTMVTDDGRRCYRPGAERESVRLLREITDLADELDRRGELEHASLDHPEILPLMDELGEALGIGPVPREA